MRVGAIVADWIASRGEADRGGSWVHRDSNCPAEG
jgi:hypothetical protein